MDPPPAHRKAVGGFFRNVEDRSNNKAPLVTASDDSVQVAAVFVVSRKSSGDKPELMSPRDRKIATYVRERKESALYFLIMDERLFGKTDCPMTPEEITEEDFPVLLDLYTHLEEYEKCQVIHAARLTT